MGGGAAAVVVILCHNGPVVVVIRHLRVSSRYYASLSLRVSPVIAPIPMFSSNRSLENKLTHTHTHTHLPYAAGLQCTGGIRPEKKNELQFYMILKKQKKKKETRQKIVIRAKPRLTCVCAVRALKTFSNFSNKIII